MEISELKKAVHEDLTAQKEKEMLENRERNSKLSEIDLYTVNADNPQVIQFKKELDTEGIKYVEKNINDNPKVKYVTQSRGQIIVVINGNNLIIGREFNTPKQLINILQRVAAPDYVKPDTEELLIEQVKNLNHNMSRAFQAFSKRLEPIVKILSELSEEAEEETNEKENK